jgi:hypothetical protein
MDMSPKDVWDFAQAACAPGAFGLAPDEPETSSRETFWKDPLLERLPFPESSSFEGH